MNSDLGEEHILSQIREQLKKEKIQLWLEPYYDSVHGIGDVQEGALQLLSEQVSERTNIDKEVCLSVLKDLQNNALKNLKSNSVFKETGVSSLKVKVSGGVQRSLTIYISTVLTATVQEFIQQVSNEIGSPVERLKIISRGRVLKPQESLASQGVKNGSHLMAVILADGGQLLESEKTLQSLESTKNDVHLLAGRSNQNHDYYLQIENQSGEALNLPHAERKALVTAMALHEKGRAALKRGDHPLALVLFLEADKEYNDCTSHLLNMCDNYALLHLDIAWCYLCLRNPAQIPDADRRLSLCEQNFHKSYGPNLERLMAIKGSTGNEKALFMRLHLLQGVVLFHQNKSAQAKQLFERAQAELNGLKVDDNSLCLLLELGFTSAEACLGLRTTQGNVELAEELLQRQRKEKELTRKLSHLKRKNERERIKLGLCADGKQMCEPSFVEQLVNMGYDRTQSVEALKMSNNRVSGAVQLIQDTPHLLPTTSSISEEAVAQVASLGFDVEVAREALRQCPDLERAVKSLSAISNSEDPVIANATALASASAMSVLEGIRNKQTSKGKKEEEAFRRISEDLLDNNSSDENLDLNLAQEEQFLMEYLSLLN